jgi:hypothetical protein
MHNKPQGCSASVASAAGPFTTKKQQKKKHVDVNISEVKLTPQFPLSQDTSACKRLVAVGVTCETTTKLRQMYSADPTFLIPVYYRVT